MPGTYAKTCWRRSPIVHTVKSFWEFWSSGPELTAFFGLRGGFSVSWADYCVWRQGEVELDPDLLDKMDSSVLAIIGVSGFGSCVAVVLIFVVLVSLFRRMLQTLQRCDPIFPDPTRGYFHLCPKKSTRWCSRPCDTSLTHWGYHHCMFLLKCPTFIISCCMKFLSFP